MKKLAYSLAILLAACACTKETAPQATPTAGNMTFSATFEGGEADTKSSLGEGNTIVWDEKDSISVFDLNTTATNSKCTLSSGAGTANGTFSGYAVKSSTGYFAMYPYNEHASFSASSDYPEGVISVLRTDYSTQYARKGNIPSNIPMVAYASAPSDGSSNVQLEFKNVFSYLKFTIDYKCEYVTISSKSGSSLTQSDYTLHFENGIPTISAITSSAVSTVTLKNEDGSALQPGTYYVAVLPQTLSDGFTMTFHSATKGGVTLSKEKTSSCTIERSKIYNLGNISLTDLIDLAGKGTEDEPYEISDFLDLQVMQMRIANGLDGYTTAYYKQTQDIDAERGHFIPIGTDNDNHVTQEFRGTYDGQNHTIRNIVYENAYVPHFYMTSDVTAYFRVYAMFGCIRNAVIKNLTIENAAEVESVETDVKPDYVRSSLVAVAMTGTVQDIREDEDCDDYSNIISNCHVTSTNVLTWNLGNCGEVFYGGLVGFNESHLVLENCTSDVPLIIKVNTTDADRVNAGGIIGYTTGAEKVKAATDDASYTASTLVNSCRNTGSITVDGGKYDQNVCIGGIIGHVYDSPHGDVCLRIGYCVNTGSMKIQNVEDNIERFEGGIIGKMDSNGFNKWTTFYYPVITTCLNKGKMASDNTNKLYAGGIMGHCFYGSLTPNLRTKVLYCVNDGKTELSTAYSMFYYEGSYDDDCASCYTTKTWNNNSGCEVKTDLTAEYMNNLNPDSTVKWRTADDGSIDLDVY